MIKPSSLVGLICLCSLPLQGAESVSAAPATLSPASSAAPSLAAAPASSAVSTALSSANAAPAPVAPSTDNPAVPISSPIMAPGAAGAMAAPPAPAQAQAAPISTQAQASAPQPKPVAPTPIATGELKAVPLYRQDELLNWIEQGRHLTQVKQDRCQLTQDIEARASVMKIPAYQFLWGDMLAWGVCIKPDAEIGVQYMWEAANQGLAPALEQLGRYYWKGILVQKDLVRAETLMREAASLGFLRAQIEWVEMLLQGMGSPLDYEEAYHWLHGAVIGDKATHQKAASLLSRLGNRMPANAIARAKAMR